LNTKMLRSLHCSLRLAGSSARQYASVKDLKKTALFGLHTEYSGKMVDFAGWAMPVQYKEGIKESHIHTRTSASVFDVSHMGQLRIEGNDRASFLESLVVGDIKGLPESAGRLTLFTNENGGIIDDSVVTNAGDHLYVVINAGCKDKDMEHIGAHLAAAKGKGMDVDVMEMEENSLIALQGPKAATVLSRFLPDSFNLAAMNFMTGVEVDIRGVKCRVTRCGYTGEDGFEVSIPTSNVVSITEELLGQEEVLPAGLGARDSLRLEAGLCLYGNDIDMTTTPAEAVLGWTISKNRREEANFLGADRILPQLKKKSDGGIPPERKRVGFVITGKAAPARQGTRIMSADGDEIGQVTSGCFSPSLNYPIGMAYVKRDFAKVETPLFFDVRGKKIEGEVRKMPFVPAQYYKAP